MNFFPIKFRIVFFIYLGSWFYSCKSKNAEERVGECLPPPPIAELKTPTELQIISPVNFGSGIRSTFIYSDTLGYILPSKPQDRIFVFDLKNGILHKEIILDPNFITSPSGIEVISPDSIFVSDSEFPTISLINGEGVVLETYNLYRENLWKMPQEGFSNFGLYFGFGLTFKYLPERHSFLIPLKQLDQWYFVKEKKYFPAIAEYDLTTREFKSQFGEYKGIYASENNTLLPFYLSHPIIEVADNRVILSYPLDSKLYIYSLDGEFLDEKCSLIPDFDLGEPLQYDMDNFDSEGLLAFSGRNSYFGNFFYVKEKNRFIRIFLKCNPNPEGTCLSKEVFALIFDENLNLTEIKSLPEKFGKNFYTYQIGFKDGFLSNVSAPESDDEFSLNNYYSIGN